MPAAALAILIALLIVGSLLPEEAKLALGTQGVFHRPLHIFLFAMAAILSRIALPSRFARVLPALLLGFGMALELVEHLMFRNAFEWRDVRDDAIGIVAGLALTWILKRWKPGSPPNGVSS